MSYPTNPTIDSGIVEAPPVSNHNNTRHQTSLTAAPSQATQDGIQTYGKETNHRQLHAQANDPETGVAETRHAGGRRPFQPTVGGESVAPPLPARDDAGRVEGFESLGVEHHGPTNLRRGDYASGASGAGDVGAHETPAGNRVYPETSSTGTGAGAGAGVGTGTENRSTGAKVRESASGAKGLVAAVHGAGETLRGTFNREVDRAFHDKAGEIKNERIAREGEAEIQEGRFTNSTKNREGVVPGSDGERRERVI